MKDPLGSDQKDSARIMLLQVLVLMRELQIAYFISLASCNIKN